MSAFQHTVEVLIKFIGLYLNNNVSHEQILLHNALSVLNHIACSVDGEEKLFMGQTGAIEVYSFVFSLSLVDCPFSPH